MQFREAQPSELDIFSLPPTQTAIENIYYQEVRPISQLSGNSPIEFIVSGQNGMEYMDLKRSKIFVKVNITHSDGSKLLSTQYVGPCNLLLHSLFSQADVTMQGKTVTSSTSYYPYKSYIETLLSYGPAVKQSQLTAALWKKDTSGSFDDADVHSGLNLGLYERANYFRESKTVDLEGFLHHDLFNLNRFILNQVAVGIKLYRTKPEFCLMTNESNADFKINIEDIVLKVCKIQVNPAVIYAHADVLKNTPALYPFTKTEIKMMAIPSGQVSFTWDNMFQGLRPTKVVVGFVSSEAVVGNYGLNPFNFEHFFLHSICLYFNSIPASGNAMKRSTSKRDWLTLNRSK